MQLTEKYLRAALSDRRFELHYQPQHSSQAGHMVGVEALVRLRDEDGLLISPYSFMDVIEKSSLIHDFGLYVFEQGCTDALLWPSLTVAINVSPAQFRDAEVARKLAAIVQAVGVQPSRIEIEITEGLFFDNPDGADATLAELHALGLGIALDDFGSGFSSLGYLLRFPVNKLKIDRSFITNLPDDSKSATIVHALVALGRALGLKIVAEGVETDEQRQFLRIAGCHILQGHLFAKALPAADISALLATA